MPQRNLPTFAQLIPRPFFASDVKWGIERRNFVHETTKAKYEPPVNPRGPVWLCGLPISGWRSCGHHKQCCNGAKCKAPGY